MTKATKKKMIRQKNLDMIVNEQPFLTDEQISQKLDVSVPTVRLDRMELGIKEMRERVKDVATKTKEKVKALSKKDIIGQLLNVELNKKGMALFETTSEMTFNNSDIVSGQYLYSFAESTALSIIDSEVALVGVANIKYKIPVKANDSIISRAEVKKIRMNNFIVWVTIFREETEVFRGKFILVAAKQKGETN
ncbi:MAG: transcription factor FapR [Clostridia bacterium]|nr:transcription factor FapR [Clostridia bacterium]